MTNVLDLFSERERRKGAASPPTHGPYLFSLHVYGDLEDPNKCSAVIEIPPDHMDLPRPELLRSYALALKTMTRCLLDDVSKMGDDVDDKVVCDVAIYGNGRVTVWTSADVQTQEQVDWAARGLDAAKGLLTP